MTVIIVHASEGEPAMYVSIQNSAVESRSDSELAEAENNYPDSHDLPMLSTTEMAYMVTEVNHSQQIHSP